MAENHQPDAYQPASSRRARLLTVLLLFALSSLFYWRLTFSNQYTWLDSNDVANQVMPWFQFQVGELQQGRLPLWDPYPFGGQPLIGQAQPGAAYPLNWLLFAMPTSHGWMRQNILHWYFVLIHFMGVWFAYLLCRDQGRSETAAVFGGLLFGLGGYMGYVDWPQMLNGAVWAPLVLMFLLRISRDERIWANAAKGGTCLGIALLSGHHQIPIFIGLASAGLWAWMIWKKRRRAVWLCAGLFFSVAVLTSGLQAVPAWEYSRLAMRWVGAPEPVGHHEPVPYYVHDMYSFLPVNTIGIVIPGLDPGMSFYVGVVAVLLGGLGIWRAWRWPAVRMATALLAAALVFAMGSHTIIHGMFYSLLPLVEKARSPLMATLVSLVCLALLVSYGVDALRDGLPEESLRQARLVLFGFGAFILSSFWVLYLFQDQSWRHDTRASMAGLIAIVAAVMLGAWQRQAVTTGALLAALGIGQFIELGMGSVSMEPHRDKSLRNLPVMAGDKPWVDAIRKLGPNERVELNSEDLPHNFADWNGVDAWHSYLASLTANIKNMYLHEGRTRELFGVRYALHKKSKPTDEWGEVLGTDESVGFTTYVNRNALPRAWVVHDIVTAKDYAETRRLMDDRSFDLRRHAFMQGVKPPSVERCTGTGDEVRILRRVSDRVRLWADLECSGLVVLSDTFYPGWEATVDGRPVPIHETYSSIRAVVTPKGKHWIEMRYRPWSVYLGLVFTLTGLALTWAVSWNFDPRLASTGQPSRHRTGRRSR